MRRDRWYVKVQIHQFLVGLEDQVEVWADQDLEIQKNEAVDVAISNEAGRERDERGLCPLHIITWQ
jgi:hypothetical protein